mgnify:CR=1 FL=1
MSESPKVFFFDERKHFDFLKGLEKLFQEAGFPALISPGARVALKVHMGEISNLTHVKPEIVAKVVRLVKDCGGEPFATDTTTLYPGGRFKASRHLETAASHGFTEQTLGAPVVIDDGEEGTEGKPVPTKAGCSFSQIEIASKIFEADVMIVISHAKGHRLSGFGGAVKNLAMGCVTKRSKAVQHAAHGLEFDEAKCNGCMKCVEECPFNALEPSDGGIPKRLESKCMHCLTCLFACPQGAYRIPKGGKERFQEALAYAAEAVIKGFKGKIVYINVVEDVTRACDCTPAGVPVVADVGILASEDPVAIDKASLDLIDASPLTLKELNVSPPDIIGKINGVDSLIQLRAAARLGVGSLDYQLVEVRVEEPVVEL